MRNNTQSRKWQITINNPMEKVTWQSFLRRINKVRRYTLFGIEEYDSVEAYFNRFEVIQEDLGVF